MNGIEYLADTNALIYLLEGQKCMDPYIDTRMAVSVITFMELLSYPAITTDDDFEIRSLLNEFDLLYINGAIMEVTINIRRHHKVKLPDAIIAATAMTHKLPLITADAGFDTIDGLTVAKLVI